MQVLYALALVPVGLLADRVHRPRLLAAGITVWSLLTMAASRVRASAPLTLRGGSDPPGLHREHRSCRRFSAVTAGYTMRTDEDAG